VGEVEPIRLNAVAGYRELQGNPAERIRNNLQALIGIGNLISTRTGFLAIENYRKALALDSTNSNVRTDMAICYRRSGIPSRRSRTKEGDLDQRAARASRYNLGVILIQDMQDVEADQGVGSAARKRAGLPVSENLKAEVARMRSMQGSGKQVYK